MAVPFPNFTHCGFNREGGGEAHLGLRLPRQRQDALTVRPHPPAPVKIAVINGTSGRLKPHELFKRGVPHELPAIAPNPPVRHDSLSYLTPPSYRLKAAVVNQIKGLGPMQISLDVKTATTRELECLRNFITDLLGDDVVGRSVTVSAAGLGFEAPPAPLLTFGHAVTVDHKPAAVIPPLPAPIDPAAAYVALGGALPPDPVDPGQRDSDGLPYDARIHSTPAKLNASDGKWRAKRGVLAALVTQVTAELRVNNPVPGGAGYVAPAVTPGSFRDMISQANTEAGEPIATASATPAPTATPAPPVSIPPPISPPPVAGSTETAPEPFAALLAKVTGAQAAGTLTTDQSIRALAHVQLTEMRELMTRPDLHKTFGEWIDYYIAGGTE